MSHPEAYVGCNYDIVGWKCTLETCCLAQSSFLYRPNVGGNIFLAIFYGIALVAQIVLGVKYKMKGFMAGMILGLVFELMGYAGRARLYFNPFDGMAFWIYLIANTIAPVFICASIYLCLARIFVLYGLSHAHLPPRLVAIGFMTSDFFSLVLQAAGGAITSVGEDYATKEKGVKTMIAGLILQVISLGVFLAICANFAWRCRRSGILDQNPARRTARSTWKFKLFGSGLLVATIFILVRSIFRVAELWQGFGGALFNDEVLFMVLDGAMVAVASLLLTVWHPGPAFGGQWTAANWYFRARKANTAPSPPAQDLVFMRSSD